MVEPFKHSCNKLMLKILIKVKFLQYIAYSMCLDKTA